MADEGTGEDRLGSIAQLLAGYIERRGVLAADIQSQEAVAARADGSREAERAAIEVRLLNAKLAMYEGEIDLLSSHLRRGRDEVAPPKASSSE